MGENRAGVLASLCARTRCVGGGLTTPKIFLWRGSLCCFFLPSKKASETRVVSCHSIVHNIMDRLEIEAIVHITTYLPAKDVLSLLSTNRAFRAVGGTGSEEEGDGGGAPFWNLLHQLHYGPVDLRTTTTTAETAKAAYLLKSHCDGLDMVRWHRIARASHGIEAREGHLACRLQDGTCIITGGFVDNDNAVYVKRMGDRQWTPTTPQSRPPTWVYGATLTPLADGRRAVRFGGFRSGGYGNETAEVCLFCESLALVVVCDDGGVKLPR
jgi:hypothetical protein